MPPKSGKGPGREDGDILRNPWEFLETSIIWGPRTHVKSPVMPQNDPTWSGECGRGRGQMGDPGLRALIKAFFRILVILANLDLEDVHFWASLSGRVSGKLDWRLQVCFRAPYRCLQKFPWISQNVSICPLRPFAAFRRHLTVEIHGQCRDTDCTATRFERQ